MHQLIMQKLGSSSRYWTKDDYSCLQVIHQQEQTFWSERRCNESVCSADIELHVTCIGRCSTTHTVKLLTSAQDSNGKWQLQQHAQETQPLESTQDSLVAPCAVSRIFLK